jgi:2-methylcitrate dehydratase PrpD
LNPLRYPIASNELEAKFCPAFMVSAIALRRKAGIHEFNDEFVRSAPVQALMRKVERVLDPEIEAKGWEKIRSTVEVDLLDGRKLVEHADERYRGGPDLPFTREELYEKWAIARRSCCPRRPSTRSSSSSTGSSRSATSRRSCARSARRRAERSAVAR